jgi:molecular chaperone GrpE
MSADQPTKDNAEDLAKAMRDAEEAVERVRAGKQDDDIEVEDDASDEADVVAAIASELSATKGELEAMKDKWLRSLADLENFKKRSRRDIDDAVHRALSSLLSDFLPVGDNLERALSAMPAGTDPNLAKGLTMVRGEFFSALARHGITPIVAVGAVFDPNLHDALQQIDSPDHPPGVVVMEYEKGYMRGEKLLRAARVIVAGPGSTGAPARAGETPN